MKRPPQAGKKGRGDLLGAALNGRPGNGHQKSRLCRNNGGCRSEMYGGACHFEVRGRRGATRALIRPHVEGDTEVEPAGNSSAYSAINLVARSRFGWVGWIATERTGDSP